jgi:DNA-binding LytR/AlgR family response regulator
MRAVIADDETLARAHLRSILESQGVEVVADVDSGSEALRQSHMLRPDLVFLDIQMPNLNGLQTASALKEIEPSPLIVFVTGYSEYAARAFDDAVFDYLLKPTSQERVALTLARARSALRMTFQADLAVVSDRADPPARLPVRSDYAIKLVPIGDILCAVAKDKRVLLRLASGEIKTAYSLAQLEKILPSAEFMRIHASVVVRLDVVEQLNYLGNHSYSATLRGGLTVPIGRGYFQELQRRLGVAA